MLIVILKRIIFIKMTGQRCRITPQSLQSENILHQIAGLLLALNRFQQADHH